MYLPVRKLSAITSNVLYAPQSMIKESRLPGVELVLSDDQGKPLSRGSKLRSEGGVNIMID